MTKLTENQQKLLDAIKTATTQIEVVDNSKTIYDYIVYSNGKTHDPSYTLAHAHIDNLKEIHVYQGHSNTLKALSKKGYIELVKIGEFEDKFTYENPAKIIELPKYIKYAVEFSNSYGNTYTQYFYTENIEFLQTYLNTAPCYQKPYIQNWSIKETEQTHQVRYKKST